MEKRSAGRGRESGGTAGPPGSRTWAFSLFWAALVVGVAIVASATINPLFGRFVHWDWMAGVAPVGFVALTFYSEVIVENLKADASELSTSRLLLDFSGVTFGKSLTIRDTDSLRAR